MNLTEGMKGWFTPYNGGNGRVRAEVVKVWGPQCVNVQLEDGSVQSSVLLKQAGCVGHFFEPDPIDEVEQLIVDKGANVAARVTKEDVLAEIVGESYTVLPSGRVTVCELTLRNGFTVRGESAVVFIENFDAEIGRKVARQNAESQVWQLLGYALRSKRYAVPTDEMVNRFLGWPLPKDFNPDCGIEFDGRKDDEWNKNKTWPIGTNLLNAIQARDMLMHVLGG